MRKLSLLALAMLFSGVTVMKAQEASEEAADDSMEAGEEKSSELTFSGSVDAYYRTTLNTDDNGGSAAPGSSFANQTGFALGMINLIAAKEGDKGGFVADLVWGPRGNDAVFGSSPAAGSSDVVNQLYAYWNVNEDLTLTIGNFNTFLGYEVISPTANFNYSTSYMFSYGPFSHTGIKADYALSENLSAMVSIMNPTDATDFTGISNPTLGFQLGYSNDNGGAWLNVQTGDQDGSLYTDTSKANLSALGATSQGSLFQVDLTTGWDLTDKVYLGFNATYNALGAVDTVIAGTDPGTYTIGEGDAESVSAFYGAAIYAQYKLSDAFALGLRGEYFSDNRNYGITGSYDGTTTGGTDAGSITDITLSGNYTVGDLTIIPEFRVDMASQDIWTDKNGDATSMLSSFTLAAVYAF